jgi:hypothetical protein
MHLVDTDTPLDQTVIAGIIRDAIDQLPERYRLAVILHYFGGMSLELIAVELKVSKQAVGTRLHRGRKMLADRLARQGVRLDNGALAGALAALVPTAVVSAVIRSASHLTTSTATSAATSMATVNVAATMPTSMGYMLRAIVCSAVHRPLRVAALAAAIAAAGSGLAMVVDPQLNSLRDIAPTNALQWLQRALRDRVPSFRPAPFSPLSDAKDSDSKSSPWIWVPKLPAMANAGPKASAKPAEPSRPGSKGPLSYGEMAFLSPPRALPGVASIKAPMKTPAGGFVGKSPVMSASSGDFFRSAAASASVALPALPVQPSLSVATSSASAADPTLDVADGASFATRNPTKTAATVAMTTHARTIDASPAAPVSPPGGCSDTPGIQISLAQGDPEGYSLGHSDSMLPHACIGRDQPGSANDGMSEPSRAIIGDASIVSVAAGAGNGVNLITGEGDGGDYVAIGSPIGSSLGSSGDFDFGHGKTSAAIAPTDQSTGLSPSVPEPTGLLVVAGAAILLRRRRGARRTHP